MKVLPTLGIAMLAAILLAGCGTSTTKSAGVCSSSSCVQGGTTGDAAASGTSSGSTASAVTPDPKGKVTGSCDMLLNDNFESSTAGWLTGDVSVHNTGNIGVLVHAKVVWKQAGGAPIVKVKPIKLGYGKTKAVHWKIPLDQNGVESYQSAPGYDSDSACSYTATIIKTLGKAR